jgi:hypothetical protein
MARPVTVLPEIEADIARIPIMGRGAVVRAWATVDAEDLPLLGAGSWCMTKSGYPVARRGGRIVYMHRIILPGDGVADHISGDKLDCRRLNLRLCAQRDNSRNSKQRPNQTGFKGVRPTACGRFNARIMVNRVGLHIGNYATPADAARAYDKAAAEHFGEFARRNFPSKPYQPEQGE